MRKLFKSFVSIVLAMVLLLTNAGVVCITAEEGAEADVTVETPDMLVKFNVPEGFNEENVESEESFTKLVLPSLRINCSLSSYSASKRNSKAVYLKGYVDESKKNGIASVANELWEYDGEIDTSRMNEEYPEIPERPTTTVTLSVLNAKKEEAILKAICEDKSITLPENYADMTNSELAEALGYETTTAFLNAKREYGKNEELFADIPEYQEYKKYQEDLAEYNDLVMEERKLSNVKLSAFYYFSEIASAHSDEEWKIFFTNELNQDAEIRYENIEILDYNGRKAVHATVYIEDMEEANGVYEYYQFNDTKTIVRIVGGTLGGSEASQLASEALSAMTIEANDELGTPKIKSVSILSEKQVLTVLEGKNNGGVLVATFIDDGEAVEVITKPADTYVRFMFDTELIEGSVVKVIWLESMDSLKPMCESKIVFSYPAGEGYAYLLSVNDDLLFNVFTQGSDFVRLFAAEEVVIDGVSYKKNDEEILNVLKNSAEAANANYPDEVNAEYSQPIKYTLDKAGALTIDTVLSPSNSTISTVMDDGSGYVAYGYRKYTTTTKKLDDKFKVSSSTKIIFVPDDRSEADKYETFSYSKAFSNSRSYHVEAYGLNENSVASLVLLYKENPIYMYTSSSPLMIVDSVVYSVATGETTIKGYTGTSYSLKSVKVNDEKIKSTASIGKGDVIRYLVDQNNKMVDYKVWFDVSEPCQLQPVSENDDLYDDWNESTLGANRILEIKATSTEPVKNYPTATFRLQYGTVTDILLDDGTGAVDEETITISPTIKEDNMEMVLEGDGVVTRKIPSSVKVYSFDRSDENAEVVAWAELDDICAYDTCGEYASRVITYSASGTLRTIYIVKDVVCPEHEKIEEPTYGEYDDPIDNDKDNVVDDPFEDGWTPPSYPDVETPSGGWDEEDDDFNINDADDPDYEPETSTEAPTEDESETDWEEPSDLETDWEEPSEDESETE